VTIPGIDVSNWNGVIDFPAVAASGVQFGIAKASEGLTYRDPYFAANWRGMKAAGLARGCYHFARPSRNTPEAEADYFLSIVTDLQPGDVLALDMEDEHATGDLSGWALTWLQHVEAAAGCRPLFYSGMWHMVPHGLQTSALADYGLWLASYQAVEPPTPAPWPFLAAWQHSSSGAVPGISGPVDLDIFNGTIDQFLQYGVPVPVVKVPDNNDLIYMVKQIASDPPNLAGLQEALVPFVP